MSARGMGAVARQEWRDGLARRWHGAFDRGVDLADSLSRVEDAVELAWLDARAGADKDGLATLRRRVRAGRRKLERG